MDAIKKLQRGIDRVRYPGAYRLLEDLREAESRRYPASKFLPRDMRDHQPFDGFFVRGEDGYSPAERIATANGYGHIVEHYRRMRDSVLYRINWRIERKLNNLAEALARQF
jgi:hypothetical protein